jgi:putative hemolysin
MDWSGELFFAGPRLVLLLAFSAFFSGAETALFSLTREQVHRLQQHGRRRYREAARLLKKPEELLASVLLGNMLVNILFFCEGAALAARLGEHRGPGAEVLAGFMLLLLVILFGEIFPKALGIAHPEQWASRAALPLGAWCRLTAPVAQGLARLQPLRRKIMHREHGVTHRELKMLLDISRGNKAVPLKEKEIIEEIVHLPDIRVREVMTPRVDVLTAPVTAESAGLLQEAARREISRIPVWREVEENVIGQVEVRDLFLDPDHVFKDHILPLVFVPETQRADALLHRFAKEQLHIVAVVDEYGGLAGVVTLDDLMGALVEEEAEDAAPQIEKTGPDTYRLSGRFPLREWRALFKGMIAEEELNSLAFDTVSGLVLSLLGRIPAEGDTVRLRNLAFCVERMHGHRIETVMLRLLPSDRGGVA